jgi:hypothetical protein
MGHLRLIHPEYLCRSPFAFANVQDVICDFAKILKDYGTCPGISSNGTDVTLNTCVAKWEIFKWYS